MKVGNNDCFMKKHKDIITLLHIFYQKEKKSYMEQKAISYDLEREQQILFCLAKLIEKIDS